ncbi:hypothetical protein EfmAA610_34960 (plasmid) [Enterococcus faecium]|nr:hypothetical protein EfmAA610_34960 [Enterococcus faecium]
MIKLVGLLDLLNHGIGKKKEMVIGTMENCIYKVINQLETIGLRLIQVGIFMPEFVNTPNFYQDSDILSKINLPKEESALQVQRTLQETQKIKINF